jgi:hypothetical protein
MRLRVALVVLASVTLTASPSAASAQKADSAMRIIRSRYERITDAASRYQQYESSLDSLGLEHWATGRGRLTAAFEGDTLRTIVASYGTTTGHVTESYYFWDGAPFEVRARLHADDSKATHDPGEQRFYFHRGYLVRWLDPGHTIHPVTTGAVFARAMQLLADATRLVDAAHRARDRAIAPETPTDIAGAMRRELGGLVTAEQSYYSETGKYSGDATLVGYHPSSPVQVTLVDASDHGVAARATIPALPGKSCVVYVGRPKKQPKTSADHARPDAEREVACDTVR